jgi:fermentation-respiration switch protein FrsA (DUF1100 family)
MTLAENLNAIADLMADAREKGDLYVKALASYGRADAGATSTGSRSLKVTAFASRDRADLAYAAFHASLERLAEAGHFKDAMRLFDSILRLSAEAQRLAIIDTCRDMGRRN